MSKLTNLKGLLYNLGHLFLVCINLFAIVVGPPILSILYSFISFMSKFSPSTNKLAPLSKIFFAINQNGILLDSVLNIGRYESYISLYCFGVSIDTT